LFSRWSAGPLAGFRPAHVHHVGARRPKTQLSDALNETSPGGPRGLMTNHEIFCFIV